MTEGLWFGLRPEVPRGGTRTKFTHEARKVDKIELRKHLAHSHLADSAPKSQKLIELLGTGG